MRDPLRVDPDRRWVARKPAAYVSSFAWDAADNMAFRPVAKLLEVDPGGEALNVNALDEVADSSWFANRLHGMDSAAIATGPCARDLDPSGADGSWRIDQGKANGATPGFRVRTAQGRYLLKTEIDGGAERASAASAIGVRLYYAAGFYTPCDSVVYFRPALLTLDPGLTITDNTGVSKPFDAAALAALLANADHRGELVRMQSSQWLAGEPLGPFRYEGVRSDDPNDVIPHEDRRELRGARLLAAWINHFDSREQNSMNVWIARDPDDPRSPGYVQHYYLDLSDSLGSTWSNDGISRRLGKSYYFDAKDISVDFLTLGLIERPWERATRDPAAPMFNYFRAEDFVPEQWKPGYQNPAFLRMTEHDGAWMARILARFRDDDLRAVIATGQLQRAEDERALFLILNRRRMAILRRYLTRLSPIADVQVTPEGVCAIDLARRAGIDARFRYHAELTQGERAMVVPVAVRDEGAICMPIVSTAPAQGPAADHPSRYRVLRIDNGVARGPLEAHFYDLGPRRGLMLVGLVRP